MKKKTLFMMLLACLIAGFAAGACATERIDMRENQHAYGACVASYSRAAPALRSRSLSGAAARVLVLLRTDGGEVDLDALGAEICVAGPGNRFSLVFSSDADAGAAVRALNADAHVLYAELDSEITACDTAPVDGIGFKTYGASNMGFPRLLSWARRCEGQSRVAIVDSGVCAHVSLADRLTSGWDYVDNDDDATNDESGHGTHVAGIVADCTQGTLVSLHAIRVLDAADRGTVSNAANAILEAVDDGCSIINLSFSGTVESSLLDDAVLTALDSGCTVVVAAGNKSMDTSGVWPAHLTDEGVIVVGAANAEGERASFSNYGESVDFYAYGSGILSCSKASGYVTKSGTSQAAPHISAACALLEVISGDLPPATLERRLKAVSGEGACNIPVLDAMVPQRVACHLEALTLGVGEALVLPVQALPLSCGERITWSTSDDSVAAVDASGRLTARSEGVTRLTGVCANFDPLVATVTVQAAPAARLCLPAGLTALEDEAFVGTAADYLVIPQGVTRVDGDPVDGNTVILCAPGSCAAEAAEASGLQYISADQDGPAG